MPYSEELREQQLLQMIERELAPRQKARWDALLEKRDATPFENGLDDAEQIEFMQLMDAVEGFQVARMEALLELAELRNVAVTTLMFELDILSDGDQAS